MTEGGLGSSIDDLTLDKLVCDNNGVKISGIIVNHVDVTKYDKIKKYLSKVFKFFIFFFRKKKVIKDQWKIPHFMCISDDKFLGNPCVRDIEHLFKTKDMSEAGLQFKSHTFKLINTFIIIYNNNNNLVIFHLLVLIWVYLWINYISN